MSSAALAIMSNNTQLTPAQAAVLAEVDADNGGAFDYTPTRIKFPSGGMMAFSIDDTDTLKPPVKAIIAVSQKSRAWWPGKDTQGLPPLCQSADGTAGIFNTEGDFTAALSFPVQHPGLQRDAGALFQCSTCPLSQWGSNGGKGQACKSLRRLIVLVEGWTMPAIMTLPPTSVKAFDQYASARARERGGAYFTCVTRIELVAETNNAGIKYSAAKFTLERPLTETELNAVIAIRHQYADLVRSLGIEGDDYATDGNGAHGGYGVPTVADSEAIPF
jgi:hypothetical protein